MSDNELLRAIQNTKTIVAIELHTFTYSKPKISDLAYEWNCQSGRRTAWCKPVRVSVTYCNGD